MNPNSIKVTVLSDQVDERKGSFIDDAGKDRAFTTRKQKAKIESAGFAYPFAVRLEDGQAAYAAGEYELSIDEMLQVNKETASLSKYTRLRRISAASGKAA